MTDAEQRKFEQLTRHMTLENDMHAAAIEAAARARRGVRHQLIDFILAHLLGRVRKPNGPS